MQRKQFVVVLIVLSTSLMIVSAGAEKDNSRLLAAAESGLTDVVKELLEEGVDVNIRDKNGFTPLILAAERGFAATVQVLLDNNAEINTKEYLFGRTALMWAVKNGHYETVKSLLKKHADVNIEDRNDLTALKFATMEGHPGIVKLLQQAGAIE